MPQIPTGQVRVNYLNPYFFSIFLKRGDFMANKWEVSILEIEDEQGKKYKVTRRYMETSICETKIYRNKSKAKKQFLEWLG